MATDSESFNRDLYDLLKVRGYNPVPLDSKNQRVSASQDSDVIEFQFTKDGEDYGKVWATVDDAQNLIIYYDSEQQDSPSTRTPGVDYDDTWTGLLKFLKMWAQRRQMSFELSNKDRLGDDMRQREYHRMKEKLGESYHPMGKKASYNDAVPSVKIILQHNRALEEGEQRYRNVARIFLENQDGERFLAPTTRPGIARVYARHIAEGGLPNDERWNHIKSVCEDYNKMAGFVRATKGKQFNESAQSLVNEGINHYNSLRENLHKMTTHRGYQAYFESYTPTLMEGEGEDISEMFMSSSLDPRIESAMPILSRLHKPIAEMNEIGSLAEWADGILAEKLDMTEGFLDKPKFTCNVPGREPEEFEAETKEQAQKLAAKKWGVDPKAVTVKGSEGATTPVSSSPEAPRDLSGLSPIERATELAKDKMKSGKVGGAVGTAGKIIGGALGLSEEESLQSNNPVGIPESYYDDEDEGEGEGFFVCLGNEEDGGFVGMVVKEDGRWKEREIAGNAPYNWGGTYMSYLTPADIMQHMRNDYGRQYDDIAGPFFGEEDAMEHARYQYGLGDLEETSKEKAARYADRASGSFQYAAGKRSDDRHYDEHGKDMKDVMGNPKWTKRSPEAMAKDDKTIQKRLSGLQKAHKILAKEEQVDEDLGPEQKRVGQLGPTEKVKNNNIGKLVGASESKEMDPELARIIEMARFKR